MAELDPALIVFLVILGAAAAVCIGYAIHRLAGIGASDSTDEQKSNEPTATVKYGTSSSKPICAFGLRHGVDRDQEPVKETKFLLSLRLLSTHSINVTNFSPSAQHGRQSVRQEAAPKRRADLGVHPHVSFSLLSCQLPLQKLLRDFFEHVVVPPQAPEKKDFGDVDMLVCGPKARLQELLAQARAEELRPPCKDRRLPLKVLQDEIVEHLNAGGHVYRDHNDVLFLHVEIPCYVETQRNNSGMLIHCVADDRQNEIDCDVVPTSEQLHNGGIEKLCQLDLQLIDAPTQLPWYSFTSSHDDLSTIVRDAARPYGVYFKPSGLFVDIDNLVGVQKGEERYELFLTSDLSAKRSSPGYRNPASSPSHPSNHITQSLIELAHVAKNHAEVARLRALPVPKKSPTVLAPPRMEKRSMYHAFAAHYLPSHPHVGHHDSDSRPRSDIPPAARTAAQTAALSFFDPLSHRLHALLYETSLQRREDTFRNRVNIELKQLLQEKALTPNAKNMARARQALYPWVTFLSHHGHGKAPTIRAEPELRLELQPRWTEQSADGGYTDDELVEWVRRHWAGLDDVERARTRLVREEVRLVIEREREERRGRVGGMLVWVAVIMVGLMVFDRFEVVGRR
ncbi:hypothetical protein LTS18_003997 [Coniosporium uncinatum]|uniref:Uncharacterized protein n=1 Tax=Coniosporium uncinatum TaxID=93489 RepID=A0ACC3DBX7_9PEZI|nr:hypothetical protein LTS18_003997 [Coniosporium uncinatum]